jgi:hypothetical protein
MPMNLRCLCVVTAVVFACGVAHSLGAQTSVAPAVSTDAGAAPDASAARTTRTVRALPLDSEIRLDGRLDDAAWAHAEVATGFVQQRPTPGEAATQRTEARILFARDAVYIGMRMWDSAPDSIATQLARRDATGLHSDWAHVLIDSYHDRRTAFRFSVNPSGVKRDVMHFNDTDEDGGWDAVWDVATAVDAEGWTAEFRIPLSQLRYQSISGADEAVWGINFIRDIARIEERSWWAPILPNSGGMVSLAGELRGLKDLPSLRRLEVMPYSVGRLTRAPEPQAGNPFYRSNALWSSFGGDVRYGVTSNLTLTATVNPDFGQVEADPSQVNLSAFETFLPERRPFFQEGADIFQFGMGVGDGSSEQLFYSRRVGRAPQRGVHLENGYTDVPEAARILGAAKLSGQLPGGWSVGVLNATTGTAYARLMDSSGLETTAPVEPLTNYSVARASRNFREGQSTVGGIFTATNRQLNDDALEFLNRAAYAGGMDVRHRFGGGNYRISASLLGSHIEGSERALLRAQTSSVRYFQRPDASHVQLDSARTSLHGMAGNVEVWKTAGGNWRWALLGTFRTPGFEVNDAGFQTDGDQVGGIGYVGYHQSEPQGPFRRWNLNVNQWQFWTFGGERVSFAGNVNGSFQLRNLWGGYGGINRNQESISTWALRGGPSIVRPGRTNAWGGINSDSRKPVTLNLRAEASREDETGGGHFALSPGVSFRPASHVSLSLSPSITWNEAMWQCAAPGSGCRVGDRYLFARMDQRTVSLTTRLNYTFAPNLSLQFYAQPYVSAGSYSEFREVVDPRAGSFEGRFRTFTGEQVSRNPETGRYEVRLGGPSQQTADFTFGNPNFNFRQLRSNAVLRWEYRPGSTLFLVWSQGRTGFDNDGTFRFRHDAGELFDAPATNVFMVKLNYWLNL